MKIAAGLLLTALVVVAPSFAAPGDWPQWRGNPQQTGLQPLPAHITRPAIGWSYRVGGVINSTNMLLSHEGDTDVVYLAPAGSLSSFSADGRQRWTRHFVQFAQIVGVFDLEHDGHLELVVAEAPESGASVDVLDAATGKTIWRSERALAQIGSVKVADLNRDGAMEVVWLPAGDSVITAWTVRRSGTTRLWRTVLEGFASPPYAPSQFAIGDVDGDGTLEVVVAGAGRDYSIRVLGGADGVPMASGVMPPPRAAFQGGGAHATLLLRDLDGDSIPEIVTLSRFSQQENPTMVQGIVVTSMKDLPRMRFSDTHPYGTNFVDGSVNDFDGDGKPDFLVSRYDSLQHINQLMLLDTLTFRAKAVAPGFVLRGVADTGTGGRRILVQPSGTGENETAPGPLRQLRVEGGAFVDTGWAQPGAPVIDRRWLEAATTVDYAGDRALTFDVDGDGVREILVHSGDEAVLAVHPDTGAVLRTIALPAGYAAETVFLPRSGPDTRLAIASDRGTLFLVDGHGGRAAATFGGSHLYRVSDRHMREPAITADLDGDGVNEIYVTTSANEIVRLRAERGTPRADVLFTGSGSLRLLALTEPHDRGLMVGGLDRSVFLRRLTPDGLESWSVPRQKEMTFMVGLNSGRFGAGARRGIVAAAGAAFPMPTYAHDAGTGAVVLQNDEDGPMYDGTFAVWDFNGDGYDDIVFGESYWKGYVLSGLDGEAISEAVLAPLFRDYGRIDYTGVPSVFDADGDGRSDILISGDDTHMLLLRPSTSGGDSRIVWHREQAQVDDERFSVAAMARLSAEVTMIGVGTARGLLLGIDSRSGEVRWQQEVGGADPELATNQVGSVISLDANGDGRLDFVVSTENGRLAAYDAATGQRTWVLDFPGHLGLGDPIASDIDGDGFSEILVPAMDGNLYEVRNERPRSRAVRK